LLRFLKRTKFFKTMADRRNARLVSLMLPLVEALGRLPLPLLRRFGDVIGTAAYRLAPQMRRRVLRNLFIALGRESSEGQLRSIALASMRHFAKGVMEFAALRALSREELDNLVRVEGFENAERAAAKGAGVIVATAHLGNWEVCASKVARLTVGGPPLTVVVRGTHDAKVTRAIVRIRTGIGLNLVSLGTSYRSLRQRLRRGEVVILLVDQGVSKHGIFVEFFGTFASAHRGAVALAMDTGAPIICAFCRREPDDTHTLTLYPPLELRITGDRERDLLRNTSMLAKIVEKQIRQRPDQWWWFHRRWKHRPAWERAIASDDKNDGMR
jgi:KDO2-lipid IV(A) lauroyltransferase